MSPLYHDNASACFQGRKRDGNTDETHGLFFGPNVVIQKRYVRCELVPSRHYDREYDYSWSSPVNAFSNFDLNTSTIPSDVSHFVNNNLKIVGDLTLSLARTNNIPYPDDLLQHEGKAKIYSRTDTEHEDVDVLVEKCYLMLDGIEKTDLDAIEVDSFDIIDKKKRPMKCRLSDTIFPIEHIVGTIENGEEFFTAGKNNRISISVDTMNCTYMHTQNEEKEIGINVHRCFDKTTKRLKHAYNYCDQRFEECFTLKDNYYTRINNSPYCDDIEYVCAKETISGSGLYTKSSMEKTCKYAYYEDMYDHERYVHFCKDNRHCLGAHDDSWVFEKGTPMYAENGNNPDRKYVYFMVSSDYSHIDLRGVDLSGADLRALNLTNTMYSELWNCPEHPPNGYVCRPTPTQNNFNMFIEPCTDQLYSSRSMFDEEQSAIAERDSTGASNINKLLESYNVNTDYYTSYQPFGYGGNEQEYNSSAAIEFFNAMKKKDPMIPYITMAETHNPYPWWEVAHHENHAPWTLQDIEDVYSDTTWKNISLRGWFLNETFDETEANETCTPEEMNTAHLNYVLKSNEINFVHDPFIKHNDTHKSVVDFINEHGIYYVKPTVRKTTYVGIPFNTSEEKNNYLDRFRVSNELSTVLSSDGYRMYDHCKYPHPTITGCAVTETGWFPTPRTASTLEWWKTVKKHEYMAYLGRFDSMYGHGEPFVENNQDPTNLYNHFGIITNSDMTSAIDSFITDVYNNSKNWNTLIWKEKVDVIATTLVNELTMFSVPPLIQCPDEFSSYGCKLKGSNANPYINENIDYNIRSPSRGAPPRGTLDDTLETLLNAANYTNQFELCHTVTVFNIEESFGNFSIDNNLLSIRTFDAEYDNINKTKLNEAGAFLKVRLFDPENPSNIVYSNVNVQINDLRDYLTDLVFHINITHSYINSTESDEHPPNEWCKTSYNGECMILEQCPDTRLENVTTLENVTRLEPVENSTRLENVTTLENVTRLENITCTSGCTPTHCIEGNWLDKASDIYITDDAEVNQLYVLTNDQSTFKKIEDATHNEIVSYVDPKHDISDFTPEARPLDIDQIPTMPDGTLNLTAILSHVDDSTNPHNDKYENKFIRIRASTGRMKIFGDVLALKNSTFKKLANCSSTYEFCLQFYNSDATQLIDTPETADVIANMNRSLVAGECATAYEQLKVTHTSSESFNISCTRTKYHTYEGLTWNLYSPYDKHIYVENSFLLDAENTIYSRIHLSSVYVMLDGVFQPLFGFDDEYVPIPYTADNIEFPGRQTAQDKSDEYWARIEKCATTSTDWKPEALISYLPNAIDGMDFSGKDMKDYVFDGVQLCLPGQAWQTYDKTQMQSVINYGNLNPTRVEYLGNNRRKIWFYMSGKYHARRVQIYNNDVLIENADFIQAPRPKTHELIYNDDDSSGSVNVTYASIWNSVETTVRDNLYNYSNHVGGVFEHDGETGTLRFEYDPVQKYDLRTYYDTSSNSLEFECWDTDNVDVPDTSAAEILFYNFTNILRYTFTGIPYGGYVEHHITSDRYTFGICSVAQNMEVTMVKGTKHNDGYEPDDDGIIEFISHVEKYEAVPTQTYEYGPENDYPVYKGSDCDWRSLKDKDINDKLECSRQMWEYGQATAKHTNNSFYPHLQKTYFMKHRVVMVDPRDEIAGAHSFSDCTHGWEPSLRGAKFNNVRAGPSRAHHRFNDINKNRLLPDGYSWAELENDNAMQLLLGPGVEISKIDDMNVTNEFYTDKIPFSIGNQYYFVFGITNVYRGFDASSIIFVGDSTLHFKHLTLKDCSFLGVNFELPTAGREHFKFTNVSFENVNWHLSSMHKLWLEAQSFTSMKYVRGAVKIYNLGSTEIMSMHNFSFRPSSSGYHTVVSNYMDVDNILLGKLDLGDFTPIDIQGRALTDALNIPGYTYNAGFFVKQNIRELNDLHMSKRSVKRLPWLTSDRALISRGYIPDPHLTSTTTYISRANGLPCREYFKQFTDDGQTEPLTLTSEDIISIYTVISADGEWQCGGERDKRSQIEVTNFKHIYGDWTVIKEENAPVEIRTHREPTWICVGGDCLFKTIEYEQAISDVELVSDMTIFNSIVLNAKQMQTSMNNTNILFSTFKNMGGATTSGTCNDITLVENSQLTCHNTNQNTFILLSKDRRIEENAVLDGLNGTGIDFGNVGQITNIKMRDVILTGANFGDEEVDNVDFNGTDLSGIDIVIKTEPPTGVVSACPNSISEPWHCIDNRWLGPNTIFDGDLVGVDITGMNFNGAELNNANLSGIISGPLHDECPKTLPKYYTCLTGTKIIHTHDAEEMIRILINDGNITIQDTSTFTYDVTDTVGLHVVPLGNNTYNVSKYIDGTLNATSQYTGDYVDIAFNTTSLNFKDNVLTPLSHNIIVGPNIVVHTLDSYEYDAMGTYSLENTVIHGNATFSIASIDYRWPSDMRNANLESLTFVSGSLLNTKINNARLPSLMNVNDVGSVTGIAAACPTVFEPAKLFCIQGYISGTDMNLVDATIPHIDDASDFSSSTFTNVVFNGQNNVVEDFECTDCTFTNVSIMNVTFKRADFINAIFEDVTFTDVAMQDCQFNNAEFIGVNIFERVDVINSVVEGENSGTVEFRSVDVYVNEQEESTTETTSTESSTETTSTESSYRRRLEQNLCSINQRVENHACVPCPAGGTNLAGDDASGDDTECLCFKQYTCSDLDTLQSNALTPVINISSLQYISGNAYNAEIVGADIYFDTYLNNTDIEDGTAYIKHLHNNDLAGTHIKEHLVGDNTYVARHVAGISYDGPCIPNINVTKSFETKEYGDAYPCDLRNLQADKITLHIEKMKDTYGWIEFKNEMNAFSDADCMNDGDCYKDDTNTYEIRLHTRDNITALHPSDLTAGNAVMLLGTDMDWRMNTTDWASAQSLLRQISKYETDNDLAIYIVDVEFDKFTLDSDISVAIAYDIDSTPVKMTSFDKGTDTTFPNAVKVTTTTGYTFVAHENNTILYMDNITFTGNINGGGKDIYFEAKQGVTLTFQSITMKDATIHINENNEYDFVWVDTTFNNIDITHWLPKSTINYSADKIKINTDSGIRGQMESCMNISQIYSTLEDDVTYRCDHGVLLGPNVNLDGVDCSELTLNYIPYNAKGRCGCRRGESTCEKRSCPKVINMPVSPFATDNIPFISTCSDGIIFHPQMTGNIGLDLTDMDLTGMDASGMDWSSFTLKNVRGRLEECPVSLPLNYFCVNKYIIGPGVSVDDADFFGIDMAGYPQETFDVTGTVYACPAAMPKQVTCGAAKDGSFSFVRSIDPTSPITEQLVYNHYQQHLCMNGEAIDSGTQIDQYGHYTCVNIDGFYSVIGFGMDITGSTFYGANLTNTDMRNVHGYLTDALKCPSILPIGWICAGETYQDTHVFYGPNSHFEQIHLRKLDPNDDWSLANSTFDSVVGAFKNNTCPEADRIPSEYTCKDGNLYGPNALVGASKQEDVSLYKDMHIRLHGKTYAFKNATNYEDMHELYYRTCKPHILKSIGVNEPSSPSDSTYRRRLSEYLRGQHDIKSYVHPSITRKK